jgi:hypothetical protein
MPFQGGGAWERRDISLKNMQAIYRTIWRRQGTPQRTWTKRGKASAARIIEMESCKWRPRGKQKEEGKRTSVRSLLRKEGWAVASLQKKTERFGGLFDFDLQICNDSGNIPVRCQVVLLAGLALALFPFLRARFGFATFHRLYGAHF